MYFFCSVLPGLYSSDPTCRPRGCHWHPQARSQGPNDTRHPFRVAQQVGTIAATPGRMALMAASCMAKFPLMSGIYIISVQICWFPRICPIKFNWRLKISRTKFTRLFWLTSWYSTSSLVSFPHFGEHFGGPPFRASSVGQPKFTSMASTWGSKCFAAWNCRASTGQGIWRVARSDCVKHKARDAGGTKPMPVDSYCMFLFISPNVLPMTWWCSHIVLLNDCSRVTCNMTFGSSPPSWAMRGRSSWSFSSFFVCILAGLVEVEIDVTCPIALSTPRGRENTIEEEQIMSRRLWGSGNAVLGPQCHRN